MKLAAFAAGFLLAVAWLDYLLGARRFHWRWPA
jgi:hypothetical protein